MKSILAIIFQIVLIVNVNGQLPGTVRPKGTPGIDFNLKNENGQKDGLWIRTWDNSPNLFSKGVFKAGTPVGVWEKYYPTGELELIQKHLAGDTVETQKFHKDGKTLAEKGIYVKRKKEGNWKMYNESGALINDEQFADSVLNGLCKYYYQNGKLQRTEVFRNGTRTGPFAEYFDNGKKRAEGSYVMDEKEGEYKAWFENGGIESEGKFLKGMMEGGWYFYNADGTIKLTMLYKQGKEVKRKYQNGTITENYDSGIPKSEYTYDDGMKNGPFTEWYDKGEYTLVDPDDPNMKKEGFQKLALVGTQIKVQGDYMSDKLEGEVTYYFEDGRIEKMEEWKDGVLIATRQAGQ